MKKLWIIIWCCAIAVRLAGVTATVSVRPARPVAGERFMVILSVDSPQRFVLQLPDMPSGLTVSRNISSNSMNTTIINSRQTVRAEYGLAAVADKAGEFVIPPVTLEFDGEKVSSSPLVFTVRDASQLPAQERLSAVLTISQERPVYVGETLRADLEIFVPRMWNLQNIRSITPENFADGIFLTSPDARGGNFVQSSELMRRKDGSSVEFSGIFQVQKSGKFFPVCRLDLLVSKGRGDFFFGPPPESRVITAAAEKALEVLPLPPPPSGVLDSGLVGTWRVQTSISKTQLRAGDIAEITLTFAGAMPGAAFRTPEITIPDARVYPPEVTKNAQLTAYTVKYPFVVMKPGEYEKMLTIATFDPVKGEYVLHRNELRYSVVPNPELSSVPAPVSAPPVSAGTQMPDDARVLPFPLKQPGETVSLPLWNNVKSTVFRLLILSAAVLAAAFWPRRKDGLRSRRRRELKKLINAVKTDGAAALKTAGSNQVAEIAGLTGATTFSEIAGHTPDAELKGFLDSLDASGFDPSAPAVAESPRLRKKLIKFLKGFLILLVSLVSLNAAGADYPEAKAAFDAGNYSAAAEKLRELIAAEKKDVSPEVLYDLGSAEYMLGNYPAAYVMFSRAQLLEPYEPDYQAAVKSVAGKLPAGAINDTMADKITGFIRPDQFILLASGLFLAGAILLCFRRRIPSVAVAAVMIVIVCGMIFSLWAARYQSSTLYSPQRAVVVVPTAQLRSIPAASGGTSTALPGGSTLKICEESGGFYRVESGSVSGWIARDEIKRILPDGVF